MGNNKILFNTTTSKVNFLTRFTAFFIALFFITLNVTAQDSLRQFLNTKPERSAKPATTKKTTDSKPRYTRSSTRNASKTPGKIVKITRGPVTVTFITAEPFAEVWLNDKKTGQSNEESRLEKKLPMGEYRVMVRNKVRVIYPLTKISISPDQTTFKLIEIKDDPPPPADNNNTTKTLTDIERINLAKDIGVEIKRILNDYGDPQKTDSISTSDWELVYRAAQVGQLQGYSAVEIEAQRWFASGQLELAKENYTNAFTAFNKANEFMPNSGLLYYAIGNTYIANKQTSDALKSYQRSLQLTPKMGMVYKRLGDAYRMLDKEKEAIAAYKNAVTFGYDNVETRLGLALTLLQTKQLDDAITQLLEVEKKKKSVEVYLALGDAYERTKRDVSAIDYYLKAVQAAPTSPVAYFKLGDVYYSQREYIKAKQSFEKAIELDPEGKVVSRAEAQKKLREAASKIK